MSYDTEQIKSLINSRDPDKRFAGRQLMLNHLPPSYFVENYLQNNERQQQNLDLFPMFRDIYDYVPQRMLLKCSRKCTKSTALSNLICLNTIRWNDYRMLYCANLERTVKNFSFSYLMPRFESPKVKELIPDMFMKDDVFEKVIHQTHSSVQLTYVQTSANRVRGLAASEIYFDEIQDISYEELPVIWEVFALSGYSRERYAGTPLTIANTIHKLWQESNQCEWMTKCTSCNHWNSCTLENNVLEMLRPYGYACSKCGKVLDTTQGLWVAANPSVTDFWGYHLAQPMVPFFNSQPTEWAKIYKKIARYLDISPPTLYNEILGISYDSAESHPVTEKQLKDCCTLGPMMDGSKFAIAEKNRHQYKIFTYGIDWGISKAATVFTLGAVRENGQFDMIYMKSFRDFNYDSHIRECARIIKDYNAIGAVDSGPDVYRGATLMELVGANRCQLVSYVRSEFIQRYRIAPDATSPTQGRWLLSRSDCMSYLFKAVREGRINFPQWSDVSGLLQDFLNVYAEHVEGVLRQELRYCHVDNDDVVHSAMYCYLTAKVYLGDPNLLGSSSTSAEGIS